MELDELEKRVLAQELKKGITKCHETEDWIRREFYKDGAEKVPELIRETLQKIYQRKDTIYEIARKLRITNNI